MKWIKTKDAIPPCGFSEGGYPTIAYVMATILNPNGKTYVAPMYYDRGIWYFVCEESRIQSEYPHGEVIAWMNYPNPFQYPKSQKNGKTD